MATNDIMFIDLINNIVIDLGFIPTNRNIMLTFVNIVWVSHRILSCAM